jgi:hypothetical protein
MIHDCPCDSERPRHILATRSQSKDREREIVPGFELSAYRVILLWVSFPRAARFPKYFHRGL